MNDTVRIVNDEQRHVHHESSLPLLSRVHEFNATIANTPLHAQTSDMLSLFPPLRYFQIYHAALKKLDDFTFQINKLRRRPLGSYEIDLFDLWSVKFEVHSIIKKPFSTKSMESSTPTLRPDLLLCFVELCSVEQ